MREYYWIKRIGGGVKLSINPIKGEYQVIKFSLTGENEFILHEIPGGNSRVTDARSGYLVGNCFNSPADALKSAKGELKRHKKEEFEVKSKAAYLKNKLLIDQYTGGEVDEE